MSTPTHDQTLIAAVAAYIASETARNPEYKAAEFARQARVTHAALSSWLGGKYAANPRNIEDKFRDVLAGRASANRLAPAKPLPTTVTEETANALDVTRNTDTMGVIHGRAGIGKSVALAAYAVAHPRTVLIKLTPESASGPGLRRAIWHALGCPSVPRGSTMFDECVKKVANAEQLFVLDDAHLLTRSGFAWVVGFHDATRAGVALVGNPEIVVTAQYLPQWHTRLALISEVDFPNVEKCAELSATARHLLKHWLGGFPQAVKELDLALCEIANKTRNLRDVEQVLRYVRHLLLNGVSPADAVTVAVAAKRFPITFKNVNALAAKPEQLALLASEKEAA